jgi:ADP-heptose:LPS heptosyltransferase
MRARDWQSNAWRKLLEMVQANQMILTYRGKNDADECLYELKNKAGGITCAQGTEKELAQALGVLGKDE